MPTVYKKTLKCIGNNSWMSSPGVTFNLTCGKGVTELQNLASLRLSSFAESYRMQQKNFYVSPKAKVAKEKVAMCATGFKPGFWGVDWGAPWVK